MKEYFFSLRSYNGILRKSNVCFNEVSRIFHASFLDRNLEGVSRMFQKSLKVVLSMFVESFREVSKVFH